MDKHALGVMLGEVIRAQLAAQPPVRTGALSIGIDLDPLKASIEALAQKLADRSDLVAELRAMADAIPALAAEFPTVDLAPVTEALGTIAEAIGRLPDPAEGLSALAAAIDRNTEAVGRVEAALRAAKRITFDSAGRMVGVEVV